MPESLNIEAGSRTNNGLKAYKDFIKVYTMDGTLEKDLLNIPPPPSKIISRILSPIAFITGTETALPAILKRRLKVISGTQGQRVYDSSGIACTQCAGDGGQGVHTGLYTVLLVFEDSGKFKE